MIAPNPCRDCDRRHTTCHADCEDYTTWAQERREEAIHTNKIKASLDMMFDYGGRWRRCVYIGRRK